jgi:hypothetical protein
MIGEADDPILQLPPLEPDRARAERVHARCRAALVRRQQVANSPRRATLPHV